MVTQTLDESKSKLQEVKTLEAEWEETNKAVLNTEEKLQENETKLAELVEEQAKLRREHTKLKKLELGKSSQLKEAREALRGVDDRVRVAQTELMSSLCGRAIFIFKGKATPTPATTTTTSMEPGPMAEEATEVADKVEVAGAEPASTSATEVAEIVNEEQAANGAETAEAVILTDNPAARGATAKYPFAFKDVRERDKISILNLPESYTKYIEWTTKQKNKVGTSLGSKDPNLGRLAGGVYEEVVEVTLKVLSEIQKMREDYRTHMRKEALNCGFRALDNFAVAGMWTSFERVLGLLDGISWVLAPEESAELKVLRLRIEVVNGDRGKAEVLAKNTLDQAKAQRWRGVIAAASSVLSSITWHNSHEY